MPRKIYEIDGADFSTLDDFYEEISRVLIPGSEWGRNLNAFDDILYGGFGTPEEGFTLKWKNSELSRDRLGYDETIRQLNRWLKTCHPSNMDGILLQIEDAQNKKGETTFETLVKIIQGHGKGSPDEKNYVELVLK